MTGKCWKLCKSSKNKWLLVKCSKQKHEYRWYFASNLYNEFIDLSKILFHSLKLGKHAVYVKNTFAHHKMEECMLKSPLGGSTRCTPQRDTFNIGMQLNISLVQY